MTSCVPPPDPDMFAFDSPGAANTVEGRFLIHVGGSGNRVQLLNVKMSGSGSRMQGLSRTLCMTPEVCDAGSSITDFVRWAS